MAPALAENNIKAFITQHGSRLGSSSHGVGGLSLFLSQLRQPEIIPARILADYVAVAPMGLL